MVIYSSLEAIVINTINSSEICREVRTNGETNSFRYDSVPYKRNLKSCDRGGIDGPLAT